MIDRVTLRKNNNAKLAILLIFMQFKPASPLLCRCYQQTPQQWISIVYSGIKTTKPALGAGFEIK